MFLICVDIIPLKKENREEKKMMTEIPYRSL